MEVKEPVDRFKAACKSIFDLIIEYVKLASQTSHERNEWFELDDGNACRIRLYNSYLDRINFGLTISMHIAEHVNGKDNLVFLRYWDENLTYTRGHNWANHPLYDKLLIEIFKDTMVGMHSYDSIQFYELLVDTNKYIHVSDIQPTQTNGQKALIERCIANNYPIYAKQLIFTIIDLVEMDWMLRILPHFKGLVKLKCSLWIQCPIDMFDNKDDETIEQERDLYITKTCKEAEEKLVRILSIDVQECTVSSITGGYYGQNIADKIKHKFYLASIYLPFKNHPLMDARLIRYTAKFM